jgi:hypothetical protein
MKIYLLQKCSNVPTFQQTLINKYINLIINNLYNGVSVGTFFFCWNTLEHFSHNSYNSLFSVGTLNRSNNPVGTSLHKLTYCKR